MLYDYIPWRKNQFWIFLVVKMTNYFHIPSVVIPSSTVWRACVLVDFRIKKSLAHNDGTFASYLLQTLLTWLINRKRFYKTLKLLLFVITWKLFFMAFKCPGWIKAVKIEGHEKYSRIRWTFAISVMKSQNIISLPSWDYICWRSP